MYQSCLQFGASTNSETFLLDEFNVTVKAGDWTFGSVSGRFTYLTISNPNNSDSNHDIFQYSIMKHVGVYPTRPYY